LPLFIPDSGDVPRSNVLSLHDDTDPIRERFPLRRAPFRVRPNTSFGIIADLSLPIAYGDLRLTTGVASSGASVFRDTSDGRSYALAHEHGEDGEHRTFPAVSVAARLIPVGLSAA
jgi:hypothetical protein